MRLRFLLPALAALLLLLAPAAHAQTSYTSSLSGGDNPLASIPDPGVGVIQGDFDADGDVDVLAFDDENYDSFTFYANNGSGSFSAATGSDNPFSSVSASDLFFSSDDTYVADFDGDNDVDIWDFEGSSSADGQSIYLENVNGSYTSSLSEGDNPLASIPDPAIGVIVGDFDSDGDIDVLAFDDENYDSFTFYANNGSGSFSPATGSDNPFSGLSASDLFFSSDDTYVADFDGDNDVDVWDFEGSSSADGQSIYLENVNGSYTSSLSGGNNPLASIPDPAVGVIQGDFDADGDVDVLTFDDENYNSFTFYANNGSGSFSAATGSDNPFSDLSASDLFFSSDDTYVADFDGDNDVDIWDFEGQSSADGQSIYLNGLFPLYVDAANGSDSNNGTSWEEAYATLQKALDEATGNDQIWIAAGTYYPDEGPGVTDGDPSAAFTLTGAQDGVALYGGFENGDAFADRDPDAHPVVLSGDIDENDAVNADGVTETTGDIAGTNSTRVFRFDGTAGAPLTSATILDGVTVTGGRADGASTESGGGLLCDGAGSGNECSPTLARVWFAGNEADRGGALALDGSGGGVSSPSLVNAVFTGNAAQSGGALYVTGAHGGTADPDVANAALTNNAATDGGAVFVSADAGGTSRMSLVQATIQGNSATNRGGAVYVTGTGTPSTAEPTLTGVILWGNSAESGGDQMAVTGAGALPTVSHTLLAGGLGAVVMLDSAFVNDGGNNLDTDPQFVNAADPDGVDDTFGTTDDGLRVTLSSPALDAGDGTALPADALDLDGDDDTSEPLPVDLTGADRVQDGTVDLGAYEGDTPALAVDAFVPTAAVPGETVTVTGSRLTNTSSVTVGGTDASFTVQSSTEVTVTVPDGAATGPLRLTMNGQTVSGPSDLGVVSAPYGPAGALDFDGTDDWVQANAVSDALADASGMTMETWVRLDDTGSGQIGLVVFNTGSGGNRNWLGYNHSPGKFLYFDEEIGADQFARTPSPTGTWHHVAATLDAAGNGILYVNGRKEATFTTSVRPAAGGVFSIGQDLDSGGPTDFMDGQMDQARLWSTALTQEQLHARMHRTVGPSDPLADDLVAAYRFDAGAGATAFDYAGPQAGTFQGDPQWTAVSAARLGQESAVATNGSGASVGPTGATLNAANVASGDTVQVYRFGTADGALRSTSDPGEDLNEILPDERSNLTWGVATPTDPASSADLTLDYGAVQTLSGPIALLRRDAPGAPWSEATGWTHDTDDQQFTHSGAVPAGQYAVAVLPVADLGVQVSPQVQSVLDGETASFSLTVTNNGPDDASAATVTLTPGNGLSGFTAASGPSTGTFDPDAHTWTIGALASGQSATLTLESTYDGAVDPTTFQAAVADSTVDDRQGNNDSFPAQVRRQAARLYVNAATGNDGNSGRSWGQAFATLTQALDAAFDGDEIWIAQGTYYPDEGPGVTDGDRAAVFTITGAQDGLKIYGGFAGGESSRDARDPEANPVVLSGDIGQDDAAFAPTENTDNDPNTPAQTDHVNGDNSYTVVHLDGTTGGTITTATVLDGVTITGGRSIAEEGNSNESTLTTNGGGLFCDGGGTGDACSPTLTDVRFRGNEAAVTGGGMSARAGDGGTTSPVLTRVTFTGNVSDVTAGGLYASTDGGTTQAAIARSHFEHNAADFDGGGFSAFARSSGTSAPTVVNTTFANNTADDEGGAIELNARANSTTSAEIANVLFLNNSAENGGAVASVTSASSGTNSTTLTNATFVGNTATQNGGALYNVAPFDGTVEPTLTNALLWDNTAGAGGPQIYNEASTVTLTVANTLLEGGLAGIVDSDGASTVDDGGNTGSDPQFVNADDPDGPDDALATADDGLRVVPGSPAENAGDGSALPADALDLDDDDNTSEPLPVDLTGAERVQDGTVDLGAYEGGTPALALDGFAPTAAAPGETVTITGTRLTNTSSVTLSGASVPFTVESSTEVTVTLPDDAATGPLQLTMNGQTVSGATDLGVLDPPCGAGTALAFDGAQDGSGAYVEAPTDVLDTTAPFTVEAWIKWDGSDGFRAFFSKPDGSTSSGVALVVFDGELRAGLDPDGSGPTRQVDLASMPANEWVHVATTYDGTTQALYVNGEQVDAASYDSERFTRASSEPVLIGREFLPGFLNDRTFPGQIDQVRTWSGTLTEAQVHARMHRTIEPDAPAASNLVASFRFDAGSGSTAFDYVGSHAGTLHNNAQWTTFSGARVGPQSAVAVNGSSASVGPSGATLTAANVASGDTVQVYRFGTPDGSVRTGSDPGEAFDAFPAVRPPVTWGVATPTDPASSADLTLDYSGVQNLSAGPVALRHRDGPGAPWTAASGWTHDAENKQFTRSGAVPAGQYAVVARPPIHVDASSGSDANRGTSWDQAFATLTKALDVATGADEIWIAEGVYVPGSSEGDSFTITGAQDGLEIYGGFSGDESTRDARDPHANVTVLSGDIGGDDNTDVNGVTETADDINGANAFHVLVLNGTSQAVTSATILDGVTVTGGQAGDGDPAVEALDGGGGLYCDGTGGTCSPTLRQMIFAGNAAELHGGAIFNLGLEDGNSSPRISYSVFTGNTAERSGGAMFNDGSGGMSSPVITNCIFAGNTAESDENGGGGNLQYG